MRILHTSDWHIGQTLYDHARFDEHAAFLSWLAGFIREYQVDALLVAGDIFDTMSPSSRSLNLYFNFLHDLEGSCCKSVIITGGNHDSPSALNAPAAYLAAHGIHVIGEKPAREEDEIIVLSNKAAEPAAVVCAVPYLRDNDVRSGAGALAENRNEQLARGVIAHYQRLREKARLRAQDSSAHAALPLLATGHLFAVNAARLDGENDFVRGTLGALPADAVAQGFQYVALGHIHTAQAAGGLETVRYSGSPLAMSFDETAPKEVVVLDLAEPGSVFHAGDVSGLPAAQTSTLHHGGSLRLTRIPVPQPRRLVRIHSDAEAALDALRECFARQDGALIELRYQNTPPGLDVHAAVTELEKAHAADANPVRVLQVFDEDAIRKFQMDGETACIDLSSLSPLDIFEKRLDAAGEPEENRALLRQLFREVLDGLAADAEAGETDGKTGTADREER